MAEWRSGSSKRVRQVAEVADYCMPARIQSSRGLRGPDGLF